MLSCRWHTQVCANFENGVVDFVGAFLLKHRECCSVHLGPEGEPVLLALMLLTIAVCCLFELPAMLTSMTGS